ncbi:Nucleotide-binding protein [Trichinella spiralis]|uniref:Nucleotide-binding protein n=1 Tax=Trichinella spiralis TaxID=6334 RepID=A0ABR3KRL7_TRISP
MNDDEHFAQMKIKRKIQMEFEMAMILSRKNNAGVASIGIHCSNRDAHWKAISKEMAEYWNQKLKESTRSKIRRDIN